MTDFRHQFTLDAVVKLRHISDRLDNIEEPSESFKREIFRTLHTIKGTAQTFGFAASGFLAHEIENLLAASAISDIFFHEAIALLTESLHSEDFEIPKSFLRRIGATNSDAVQTNQSLGFSAPEVPEEFSMQLSNQEKIALRSAAQADKNLFCLEVEFTVADFADGLINFREKLNAAGEIIATLPSAKFSADGGIGFQILYASSSETSKIKMLVEESDAEIIFDSSQKSSSNSLQDIAAHAVRHGRETAVKCGKQIDFEVAVEIEAPLSADVLKIVFDILLHLVRNAVDHAIETAGKIKIHLQIQKEDLQLVFSDDGSGIDLPRLKARAIEKNLHPAVAILTAQETLDLIFLPEFSTKSKITEISGRGVGLDAVKTAVTKAGGTISVRSERGNGTTFEIFLPLL